MTNKEHIQKLESEMATLRGEIKAERKRYYEAKTPTDRFNIKNAIEAMEEVNKTKAELIGLYKYQDSLTNGLATQPAA